MPNQPAADSRGIYIRVHKSIKQTIQDEVDRLNADNPGARYTIASWIRGSIGASLNNPNGDRKSVV